MMRDTKFLRRNSGKNLHLEEIENVPVHVNLHEPSARMSMDSYSRSPLNTIQEPLQNPSKPDQELGFKSSKIYRTPSKSKVRYPESSMPMKTPEKQGVLSRNRYGWCEDSRIEGRIGKVNTPRSCRTLGRTNSVLLEPNATPTKSAHKPPNPGLVYGGSFRPPAFTGARISNFTALSKGIPVICNTSTTVNAVEVPHFDLREDPSFWMDHNVQVLIRIRPLNGMEINSQGHNRCLKQENAQCLTWVGHPETRFTFDHVACESIDQETLFKMVGLPMVENCLSGYNSCMFAYGQTGSGKTHTMLGEINDLEVKPSPYRGMTPRIFEFLFARIIAEEESRRDERLQYNCKCSFLEIYNEQITDLLDPSSTNLQLREDVKKGVYVENLTEFEVNTVGDILKLLSQGSANRRVAATNMNRESSRSHSVFTCVIESTWEKDSTSNLRYARLNLVDLAGSERQKSSGAEGERLKEAANINKSLSTLGHVIMVLVDGANAKTRHVPYRDSKLTFLLQDSLGGNSKTMIIANVSPSISSATETLNTLKFAQRAKLIQNNAVINEDASGDVAALQHQIRLLKEELAILKRQNISRSLTFSSKNVEETRQEHGSFSNASSLEMNLLKVNKMVGDDNNFLRVSCKQLKSLETSLNGALRREQSTEHSIKQLEAEIEQLNCLVHQREEENRCTKMMLKFREEKIQRMESVLAGSMPASSYLLEENNMLKEEIRILRAKVDRNPEVTRFAVENIRLLEQLRRFQDFYEDGEREMLLTEVTELRDQLVLFLDENSKQDNHMNSSYEKEAAEDKKENVSLQSELKRSQEELEKCRDNLNSCLEKNAKLCREIVDLNDLLEMQKSAVHDQDGGFEVIKESILEVEKKDEIGDQSSHTVEKKDKIVANKAEEVVDLQLEVEILKIILKEERSTLRETEDKFLLITKQCKNLKEELQEAKSVIEALEIQQLVSINQMEDLKDSNKKYAQMLRENELKIMSLNHLEIKDSTLKAKLNKVQNSLEKAKKRNVADEEEMDEVRRQVEAETTEVIVCLQDELVSFQKQIQESSLKERDTQQELTHLQEKLEVMTKSNKELRDKCEESDLLTNMIEEVLTAGHKTLDEATNQLGPGKRTWVSEQLQIVARNITEKELRIEELNSCLEEAKSRGNEMDCMLRSLRGATLVMSEAHQQDCRKKDEEINELYLQLSEKNSIITQLKEQVKATSICATAAFVMVNRFSEIKEDEIEKLKESLMAKDSLLHNQAVAINNAEKQIESLKSELETVAKLHSEKEIQFSENQRRSIEFIVPQVLALQAVVDNFEEQIGPAAVSLDRKLQTVEELVQQSRKSCHQKRKLYELELMDAKLNAAQQSVESSCYLDKFLETQDTIEEADFVIKKLVTENEAMKTDIMELKKKEYALINERDMVKESYSVLEKQLERDIDETKREVEELEDTILQIQATVDEDHMPTASDFFDIKCRFYESSTLMRSWCEDIWSKIIAKDWAVSVLHVCYMGKLTETVAAFKQMKDSILSEKDAEVGLFQKEVEMREAALKISSNRVSALETSLIELQHEVEITGAELRNTRLHTEENEALVVTLKVQKEETETSFEALMYEHYENIVRAEVLETYFKECEYTKELIEEQLVDTKAAKENLEIEILEYKNVLEDKNTLIELLNRDLGNITCERHNLHVELHSTRKDMKMAQVLAEEHVAIATKAKQAVETIKLYSEEKEAELKLYEKSVEELECTVKVLENQVDMVKGDAERQRLQREELELELHNLKKQIHSFKASEAMGNQIQVKPDGSSPYMLNSPSKKLERSRSRGSGSPFKCIGLGLVQQMKSENDEELTAAKVRIEELEVLAASRQTEISTLNAKLAISGIKPDATTYSSIMDDNQLQEVNEQEVMKLKQQVNELVAERQRWQEEIERKQEENEVLKALNDEIDRKQRRAEAIVNRVKEELASLREANGRNPDTLFDTEQKT